MLSELAFCGLEHGALSGVRATPEVFFRLDGWRAPMKLNDRVSIITGGNSGIGKATAVLFAREGSKVVMAGRNASRGKEVVEAIRKSQGEAIFVKTDVSKSPDVTSLVETAVKEFGRID